jgi:DNA-binding NtrC family response regulator
MTGETKRPGTRGNPIQPPTESRDARKIADWFIEALMIEIERGESVPIIELGNRIDDELARRVCELTGWNVTGAARMLQVNRTTLVERLRAAQRRARKRARALELEAGRTVDA